MVDSEEVFLEEDGYPLFKRKKSFILSKEPVSWFVIMKKALDHLALELIIFPSFDQVNIHESLRLVNVSPLTVSISPTTPVLNV